VSVVLYNKAYILRSIAGTR